MPSILKNSLNKSLLFIQSYRHQNVNNRIFIIIIAGFALINILSIYPDLYSIYSKYGIISGSVNDKFVADDKIKISLLVEKIILITNIAYKYAFIIPFITYIISLIMILIGYGRILFSILVIVLHTIFLNSAYLLSYGADFMISFLLYINLFFCIEDKIKIQKYKGIVFSFAIRLTQIQLCIIYFFGGFGKALGFDWYDGNAVWLCLNHYLGDNIINSFFSKIPTFIYQLTSLHILFIELLFPILIFFSPKIRKMTIIDIIILHLIIALIIKIYTFSFIMILLNIIAFYPSLFTETLAFFNKKFIKL